MLTTTVKYLFVFTFFTIFAATRLFAQATITIGTVDAGPYSPGSTVAVPFHINDATGCISRTNVFRVEMSDAAGSFTAPVIVGTSPANTFYANFLNATIPNGTPVGNGYRFRITATSTGVATSAASNAVDINNTAGANSVAAAGSIPSITPEVFGNCNGPANGAYTIYDNGSGAATLRASFFNEATQIMEVTNQDITGPGYQFTAAQATYTVFIKSTTAGGKISTRAYQLINNQINSSIGLSGNGTVCIAPVPGGTAPLTYNIDITGVNGIQKNYPGNLYTFSWGDGTPNTILTLCDIIALNGQVTHPYTRESCSNASGQNGRFQVDINISNPYCGNLGSPVTSYARILRTPTNAITGGIPNICTGTTITFGNGSDPGVDPNSGTLTCAQNPNARYTWYVDGVLQTSPAGVPIGTGFTYTFSVHGNHTVTLRALNANGGACTAADATFTVCVEDPPVANFTIPAGPICNTTTITPTNTSVLDPAPCAVRTYNWTVSPANYTLGGGTTLNSAQPQFNFTQAGFYTISLNITSVCGTSNTVTRTIIVDATPTATLQGDLSLCATQTINFNASRVTFTGTTAESYTANPTTTYTWTVTGGSFSFVGGTNASSQYPQIQFNDFATYTVTVTHANSCNPVGVSDSQNITFQPAPSVNAGADQVVCQAAGTVNVTGVISGTYNTSTWSVVTGSNAGSLTTPNSLTAGYTPNAADYTRGFVTLRLTATTNALPPPCNNVTDEVIITLVPTAVITSPATTNTCSGTPLAYNITSNNNTGTTYTWTATSTTATGFTPNGTSNSITDVLISNDLTQDATVTYTITPTTNGCVGTTSTVTVTIPAVPVITATAANPAICSGSPAGITMASNQTGTQYRWTANAPAGISSPTNLNQTALTTTATIANTLINSTTGVLRVTYTITPYNVAGCAGTPVNVFVDVNPPTPAATVGPTQNLCNETQATLTGNNPGASFTGQWTQVSGNTVTITTPNSFQTTVTGLVGGQNYTFAWTINGIAPCGPTSAQITINNGLATLGGTTGGTATVCQGSNNGTVTLTGQQGNILSWETSIDGGNTWQTVAITTPNISYTNITQTTIYRAVLRSGSCTIERSTPTTITVNPQTPQANAGANLVLCNETTATLNATLPNGFTGQWTQTGGDPLTITDPTNPQTTVTGLTGDKVYTLTWTVNGLAPCGPTSAQITITNSAPTVAGNTSPNTTVCRGENGQVTLTGHRGNILYWEQTVDAGVNWTRVNITTATLSYTNIQQTTQYRARVQNGSCDTLTSPLTVVTVNQPPPQANAGPNRIRCNLTIDTLRANNPGPLFTGTWTQVSGLPVTITNPNNYETTVTGLTGANNYVFRWTITALAPCVDTFDEVTITNNPDVVASFTANTKVGCGNLEVTFTNTSNNQTGANFIWNFGDGQTSIAASPQHTFAQRTDGRDTTYYISLAVQGNCVQRAPIVDSILVRPALPLPRILPASTAGCGNYAIDIRNTTPGNNVSYVFYLYDGNTLLQTITKTDKTNAVFNPISTTARKVFTVYMVATGYCNNTAETTHIPVTISPSDVVAQMVIQGGINAGCAPLNTTLINNSFGGDNFYYNIYDANNNLVDRPVAGTTPLPYRFSTTGTYYVTITAISNCGSTESPRTRIDVYPTPTPSFVADITTACKDALITFTNNTVSNDPNTPVTSLLYDWDFGDGSTHSALFAPTHAYHYTGTPYTVTLRATNTTSGCTQIFVRTAYIDLYGPPKTAFTISPDSVTTIPNYTFSFIDRTPADAVSWRWTFGDGQTSTSRNPTITYPDTGVYRVTLTTATATGCDSTVTRTVRIGGVPGQLFLPNAFMPESATIELRTFMAKGSGIKTWRLQIFNNYGQLVWQTTKLSPKGEPEEGWDGTFKGVPAPQGVYQWQASATFINGTEWKGNSYRDELPKRVGSVHLIR